MIWVDTVRFKSENILYLLFFFSGFSALLYQVVWQRILGFFVGVEVISVSLISASFMLGMGAGSLSGGVLADKLNSRSKMVFAFALAELFIGIFGASSKMFYYDYLYGIVPELGNSPASAFTILLISLLFPTFLMGMTLPLLAKVLTESIDKATRSISFIYAVNTFGAAVGSLFCAFYLIRNFGYENSLYFGAGTSILCAITASWLGFRLKPQSEVELSKITEPQFDHSSLEEGQLKIGFWFWVAIYCFSGFSALGLEIVWFRLLNVMLKSNSMVYGYLLFIYLAGLSIGTILSVFVARKTKNPARLFLVTQSIVVLYAVVSVYLLVNSLGKVPLLNDIFNFFSRYNPIYFALNEKVPFELLLGLYVIIPFVLILPSTILMGVSFGLLQKTVQKDLSFIGRRLGWLQTANIVGSALGALIIALVVLNYIGTSGALKLFTVCGFVFLVIWLIRDPKIAKLNMFLRNGIRLAPLVICLVSLSVLPGNKLLWAKLHGMPSSEYFIVSEDSTGIVAYRSMDGTSTEGMWIYVNGQGHSEVPYGVSHAISGALPVFLHPNPQDVALIGFGSGETMYAASANRKTKSVDCYEIVRPELECLLKWDKVHPYKPVSNFMNDSRIKIVFEDGRKGLSRRKKLYDIIQTDPLRPFDSGAGMLYSVEFFQQVSSYLKPGGYAVIWIPTDRVRYTLFAAFPHIRLFGCLAICSNDPIEFDLKKTIDSYKNDSISGFLEATGTNIYGELLNCLNNETIYERKSYMSKDINTDLYPKDEYMIPESKRD